MAKKKATSRPKGKVSSSKKSNRANPEKYVHPAYKNMTTKKAATVDKLVAMGSKGKNKGKASDVAKNMKEIQKDIKSLGRTRGSRTKNTGSEPRYKGYRGGYSTRAGLGGGGGMNWGTK